MGEREGSGAASEPPRTGELLSGWLAGDREAERRLFGEQREVLLGRVRGHPRYGPLRRQHAPGDVVDEVFLRALASGLLARFEDRGRGSLRAALGKILDRTLVDLARRSSAQKRSANVSSLDSDPERGESAPRWNRPTSMDPSPTGEARASELRELCRTHLDEREWSAWRLVELEGLSSEEAAVRLGISSAAVRGLLFRARRKLIRALGEGEGE